MGLILDSVDYCFAFFNKDPPGLHTVANKANSKTMLVSELKAAHLKLKCRITQKNSVKFLPAPAAFFGGVFLHTVERCSLTLERMVFLHA